jgi:hypothetical protein
MEPILSYLGWFIFIGIVLYFLVSRKFSNNPHGITSIYVSTLAVYDSYDISDKVIAALNNSAFRHVRFDAAESRFYAENLITMSSWGEHIIVEMDRDGEITRLNFISVCALPIQIYDWGKNKRNFRKFHRELRKLTSLDGVKLVTAS